MIANGSWSTGKAILDKLYARYNKRHFVHPDPIEFLYDYPDLHDREIAGLIASSLAYGRVAQILKGVSLVLERMDCPYRFVMSASQARIERTFAGFKHRFTSGEELAAMLLGIKHVVSRYGSLQNCFTAGLKTEDETVLGALSAFAEKLCVRFKGRRNSLLPSPARGSACKRLNLFVRWMVRRDEVDPGGWDCVPASKLIVPLDTHMYRIARALGFTDRRQADMRTALEVTAAFRAIAPNDPVRYDFALTRLGIRNDTNLGAFLERFERVIRRRGEDEVERFEN